MVEKRVQHHRKNGNDRASSEPTATLQQQHPADESALLTCALPTTTTTTNTIIDHAHIYTPSAAEVEDSLGLQPTATNTNSRDSNPDAQSPLWWLSELRSAAEKTPPKKVAERNNRRHRRNSHTDTFWFIFLILSGLSPDSSLYPTAAPKKLTMTQISSNMRTLFDPMIGEFCADTSPQVLDKFFNSKLRWRDENSWYPVAAIKDQQGPVQLNMLMTEQPPIIRTGGQSVTTQVTNSNRSEPAADPSLMDYEAIDVYWRRDIEMEKGISTDFYSSSLHGGQGCSASSSSAAAPTCTVPADVSTDQFERDLQLLREKSLFTPLTHEENFRYENLSKAHYADFYRTVPSAAAKRWQSASNTSSTSGYSNDTEQYRPISPAKSNISSFSTFDENEAANFFSNLAKQSILEENRPTTLASLQPPQQQSQLQTYSNLTLCNDQSTVLNNVSLIHEASLPGAWANDTFFDPGMGIRGSADVDAAQTEPAEQSDEDILEGVAAQPLEITDSEANALLTSLQSSEYLEDAVQLHEFIGMEMLGEFQRNSSICGDKRLDSPIPENVLSCVQGDRETSPSSGIGSMQSSSSSPNRNEEFNGSEQGTEDYEYRFYGKLAPKLRDHSSSFSTDASADSFKHPQEVLRKPTKSRGPTSGASAQQRKRGRQSKDEQLAQEHDLPASAEEFAAMSHMEIQSYMRDPKLTHQQKSLIKKIRRRGRNKVAARKCRERRNVPGSVYGQQDDYTIREEDEEELQSNYDPAEMSLYEF